MNGIAAGGGPMDVRSLSRWRRNIARRARLKVGRWPGRNVVTLMLVVTMRWFLGDRVARKADRHSDRSDKALDHGSMLLMES
jgi:hypothetical protein